ncbi:MAG: hypothetical protein PF574_04065 [Candidatus Delongbacteria bacterium]|jgi:hypothetical protein|nr:hypothetical protein [Candidatus Delongbacteria bacterium]
MIIMKAHILVLFFVTVCVMLGQDKIYIGKYAKELACKSLSEEEQKQHIKDYNEKAERFGNEEVNWMLKNDSPYGGWYYNMININEIEEFKKIGIDLTQKGENIGDASTIFRDFKIKDESNQLLQVSDVYFYTNIIAVGTVIDSISPIPGMEIGSFGYPNYRVKYDIKINEFIKGDFYYKKPNPTITIYKKNGGYIIDSDGTKILKNYYKKGSSKEYYNFADFRTYGIGDKVILFLQFSYKDGINSPFTDDPALTKKSKLLNIFFDEEEAIFEITDGYFQRFNTGAMEKSYRKYLGTKFVDSFCIKADEFINFFKRLEEINDTPNFYNRSYK